MQLSEYSARPRYFVQEQRGTTNEWGKTYSDMAGRKYKTVYATASGSNPYSQSFYDSFDSITNFIDPDGVSTLYPYDAYGRQLFTVIDTNLNGQMGLGF